MNNSKEQEFLKGIQVADRMIIGKSTKGFEKYQYRGTLLELLKEFKKYLNK